MGGKKHHLLFTTQHPRRYTMCNFVVINYTSNQLNSKICVDFLKPNWRIYHLFLGYYANGHYKVSRIIIICYKKSSDLDSINHPLRGEL